MTGPGMRSAPAGRDQGTPQTLGTAFDVKRIPSPDLVRDADIESLVLAIASIARYDPFAVAHVDGDLMFRCPRPHRYHAHNAGPARIVTRWKWTCDVCRVDGSRYELERLVLESSTAVESLQEIIAERMAVAS